MSLTNAYRRLAARLAWQQRAQAEERARAAGCVDPFGSAWRFTDKTLERRIMLAQLRAATRQTMGLT